MTPPISSGLEDRLDQFADAMPGEHAAEPLSGSMRPKFSGQRLRREHPAADGRTA